MYIGADFCLLEPLNVWWHLNYRSDTLDTVISTGHNNI